MITRLQGPMQEQLINVEDESVDLLLTDPPYNISNNGAKPEWKDPVTGENKNSIHSQRFSESFDEDWDAVSHEDFLLQLDDWSKHWFKKMRKGAAFAVFISDQYISYLWKIMEANGFEPKRIIVWKKPAAVPFNRKVNPVSGCEYILWGIKPKGKRTFNAATQSGNLVDRHAIADKIASIVYKRIREDIDAAYITMEQVLADAAVEARKMLDGRKVVNGEIQAVIPNTITEQALEDDEVDPAQKIAQLEAELDALKKQLGHSEEEVTDLPNTITFSGGGGKKIHPTQKPVEVLQYFVELLTNPGDLVLDTFAGSGSTGKACEKSGRNAVLIERDAKMFAAMDAEF